MRYREIVTMQMGQSRDDIAVRLDTSRVRSPIQYGPFGSQTILDRIRKIALSNHLPQPVSCAPKWSLLFDPSTKPDTGEPTLRTDFSSAKQAAAFGKVFCLLKPYSEPT